MKKKSLREDRTVIMSDKYLSEAGLQGGKIIGEKLTLISFSIGIPLFIIGLLAIIDMLFDLGFPINKATIIGVFLVIVIGLSLIIGGYFNYRDKHAEN